MDLMFQWFYDVLTLTVIALFLYSSAKKGFSKIAFVMVGYVFSLFVSSAISPPLSEKIYTEFIQKNNISEISQNISKLNLTQKYQSYIDHMGYNIKTDSNELEKIFLNESDITDKVYTYCRSIEGAEIDSKENFSEKFRFGYAEIIFDALKDDIPEYALSSLYSQNFNTDEGITSIYSETPSEIGIYIEKNCLYIPCVSVIKRILFIIILFALMTIMRIIADKINKFEFIKLSGASNRIIGGVLGIAEAFLILAVISIAVKILVLLGNNEMMLFNTEIIEKTKIFRYIYNLKYIN